MSSMRNAVQRRTHKERAQPLERQKWGVLEKHKDYSLRAKDYNEKKKRLKILRQKAAERNPDEFHFGMMSSKTDKNGQRLADRGNKALSVDAVKLLKTQDAGYLRTMAQKTRRVREKLEQEFFLGAGSEDGKRVSTLKERSNIARAQHIVYVESREEQKDWDPKLRASNVQNTTLQQPLKESVLNNLDSNEGGNHDRKAASKHKQKPKSPVVQSGLALKAERIARKQRKRDQEARKSKLEALKRRENDLVAAELELDIQRGKMSNSIGGTTKTGLKWKVRERKR